MEYPKDYHNKIILGDSLSVMRTMPDESVDLVVTSPPYNLRDSTGNGMRNGKGSLWKNAKLRKGYSNYADDMPYQEYITWQRNCLLEMFRLLKPDGAIFYNHKWRVQKGILQDRSEIVKGLPVRQIIIWYRSGGINFNPGYFLPTYEVIYLITKSEFKLKPKANEYSDVWSINPAVNNDHPAPFPLELARRCISSTNADIILDPFSGSGTTALAAKQLGRTYIGIDISEEYCDMARKRLQKEDKVDMYLKQESLF